ncbi:MAG: ATP synthase F1 subunit gamma [Bacteroidetes bacterium]|nr:ATP synthase F1 subunit gamma [Bacteroidota bacterium]
MAKYREIRSRIQGVDNTAKITQAMKMVSAAKLRRAQDAIIAARPYGQKLREMLQFLAANVDSTVSPLLEQRPVGRVCLVIVTADRGLCGAFNSNVIKGALNLIKGELQPFAAHGRLDLVCIGKRCVDFFARREFNVIANYPGIFNALDFSVAQQIVSMLSTGFLSQQYDRVIVLHNEFKSAVKQNVVQVQLLPVPKIESADPHGAISPQLDYIFEPSRDEILDALLPKHLNTQMWNMLLDSNAAEQGARMAAMENATKNARDLVKTLRRSYNRARQTAITTEILEIVSGAEALKSQ